MDIYTKSNYISIFKSEKMNRVNSNGKNKLEKKVIVEEIFEGTGFIGNNIFLKKK